MISVKITRDAEQQSGDTGTAADNMSFSQEEPGTSSYEAWLLMEDFITLNFNDFIQLYMIEYEHNESIPPFNIHGFRRVGKCQTMSQKNA